MIVADEAADVSDKEQLDSFICWVDVKFLIHKNFVGMNSIYSKNHCQVGR